MGGVRLKFQLFRVYRAKLLLGAEQIVVGGDVLEQTQQLRLALYLQFLDMEITIVLHRLLALVLWVPHLLAVETHFSVGKIFEKVAGGP